MSRYASWRVGLLMASLFLTGCEFVRAFTFNEDDSSGHVERQTSKLLLVDEQSRDDRAGTVPALDPELRNVLANCAAGEAEESATALVLPIAGFLVQSALDGAVDALASRIEELRQKSQKTYRASVILDDPRDFGRANTCLVFVRSERDESNPGELADAPPAFVLVLQIEPRGGAQNPTSFTLKPTYLRVNRAAAITGDGEPITVAVAFAGKAARLVKNEPKIDIFAEQSIEISNVKLGEQVKHLPENIGLIPSAPVATALEVSIAITESGSALPNSDKAKAELEALAKAVGPAIKSQVERLLKGTE